jgi:hypothetical protein
MDSTNVIMTDVEFLLSDFYSSALRYYGECRYSECRFSECRGALGYVCHPSFLYDNKYASIIDIYFYECFSLFLNLLDTLSDILDNCLRFSLIKIESVQAKPCLILSSLLFTHFY